MKKMSIILLSVFILFCVSRSALAHPPVKIDITYDALNKVITAIVVHPVQNPAQHYINKVDVSINGKEILEQNISAQENADSQTVSYRISDVKPEDVIGVEGYCNINGKLEKTIKVQ